MADPRGISGGRDDDASGLSLSRILDRAGFGIAISAGTGEAVFANACATLPSAPHRRTRHFPVVCDGRAYCIDLTTDESEHATREDELIRRAYFDELTQLPNRALIERTVAAMIESGEESFALAFIDLDGFKQVNDFFGHEAGDELLARIAERLSRDLRPSDMLARLSGDEFALLIAPAADLDDLKARIARVSARIRDPFVIAGHEVLSSASIGVSRYPVDARAYTTLRDHADRAMYRGKGRGKGTVEFYDSSIEHAVAERSRLEQRLRLAIRDRRVRCAYQPKVSLRGGGVTGVEVLMRWLDEDGVIQPPGAFLKLAGELGLMDDLTLSLLAETVASIDRLNEAFGRDCPISLNVAAAQAGDVAFMRVLVDALEETGFPGRFMLELTEEAFLAKTDFQTDVLPMIRAVGARVSIDDFGIGYSSLSALADITADEVKVDRAFITDIHKRPRSQSILKAIESLGQSLGMAIVVEGVETFEEVAYLQAATRIQTAQGFYYAPPMLLSEMAAGALREPQRGEDPARGDQAGRTAASARSR